MRSVCLFPGSIVNVSSNSCCDSQFGHAGKLLVKTLPPLSHLRWWSLAITVLAGCNGSPTTPPAQSQSSPATTAATAKSNPVDDMLQSAIYHLQPDNVDLDEQAAVSVLNDWLQQTATFDPKSAGLTNEALASLPDGWLTAEQKTKLTSPTFTVADAVYVRDALLTSSMAKYAAADHQSELDRVVAIFDFTMRTVTLQNASVPQLPFPLREILILGQGTPDDRAWTFAALLKQQRIDSVILQSKDDPEARLVGVILDDKVYLFDTKLGLPIPRGDDPPAGRITRPATIDEMQAHPDWWQALTLRADQPYPWSTEQLDAADVFVYTAGESWNGRMQQLEKVLPKESSCALYDPLVDTSSQTSLVKRIQVGHADWSADKLRPWPHPLNVADRVRQMSEQMQQLAMIFQRLRVPLVVDRPKKVRQKVMGQEAIEEAMGKNPFREEAVFDMEGPKKIIAKDQLSKARIELLLGRFSDAIRNLHQVRMLALESPPQELPPQELQNWTVLYQVAAVDATYWSAATKFEQAGAAGAESAFRDFFKRFGRSSWGSASQYRLALILAGQQKYAEARRVVSSLGSDDPHRPGLEVLEKRWAALEEKAPVESQSDAEPASQDPPAKEPGS